MNSYYPPDDPYQSHSHSAPNSYYGPKPFGPPGYGPSPYGYGQPAKTPSSGGAVIAVLLIAFFIVSLLGGVGIAAVSWMVTVRRNAAEEAAHQDAIARQHAEEQRLADAQAREDEYQRQIDEQQRLLEEQRVQNEYTVPEPVEPDPVAPSPDPYAGDPYGGGNPYGVDPGAPGSSIQQMIDEARQRREAIMEENRRRHEEFMEQMRQRTSNPYGGGESPQERSQRIREEMQRRIDEMRSGRP